MPTEPSDVERAREWLRKNTDDGASPGHTRVVDSGDGFLSRMNDGKCLTLGELLAAFAAAENRELRSKLEVELCERHYFHDEGIAPDGQLRPLVSKLIARVEQAEQENRELRERLDAQREIMDGMEKGWQAMKQRAEIAESQLRELAEAARRFRGAAERVVCDESAMPSDMAEWSDACDALAAVLEKLNGTVKP